MKHKVKIIYFNFFQDVKKKVIEIVFISLLFAISINIKRIYLLIKKRDENKEIDRPSRVIFHKLVIR